MKKAAYAMLLGICFLTAGLLIGCPGPSGSSLSSEKAITSFSLNGTAGTINGTTISVVVPPSLNPAGLVATFATTGDHVTVNGTTQVSGTTANNFTNPVTYIVTAQDGSTAGYVVTVTVLTSCTADSQCGSGNYCDGSTNTCKPKQANGSYCTASNQCSTACVNNICQ